MPGGQGQTGWDGWGGLEEAVEWFKHAVLGNSLVGLVEDRTSKDVVFIVYDTSVNDVDIVINKEMVGLGLARKSWKMNYGSVSTFQIMFW